MKEEDYSTKFSLFMITMSVFFSLMNIDIVFGQTDELTDEGRYDSGYQHGCNDAKVDENLTEKYLEVHPPEEHTPTFMNGYYDGFKDCNGLGDVHNIGNIE